MEEIKTKGIVVKAVDFKDSDKLVTIFSLELGLIRARVRGVKKSGAKLVFAVQPFAFVEFMLTERSGFYTVINATSIDQFFDMTLDFDSYILGLGCLELIEKSVKENAPEEELFVLMLSCLDLFCYKKLEPMVVFIKFMLEALKVIGFGIELSSCTVCGEKIKSNAGFSFDRNGLVCESCQRKIDVLELSAGELTILTKVDEASFKSLGTLKFLSRSDLVSVITLLLKIFRLSTDEEIEAVKMFLV